MGTTANSFHKRKTLDCYDAKLSTALAHLGRLLIFWRIIPASYCTQIRKFEYRYTTWNRPITFKYDSPENQEASKVRQSGAKFRIIAIQGFPLVK